MKAMPTILLIEDNEYIRENTTEILELEGYKVISANNGKEGIAKAEQEAPDLILCDILMPEMNGHEVLITFRGRSNFFATPFIFFTAYSESKEVATAMKMGANDYIVKPFEPDNLLSIITKHLK